MSAQLAPAAAESDIYSTALFRLFDFNNDWEAAFRFDI